MKYLVNSRLQSEYQERNIIDLTCIARQGELCSVKGLFSLYRKESGDPVFMLTEQYSSEFMIEKSGRMEIDPKYHLPNLRHVPTFPDRDLKPGDTWKAGVNLLLRNFSIPLNLILEAQYTLVEIKKGDGREVAVIQYNFTIDKDLSKGRYPEDYPVKIFGRNSGTIEWDITGSSPGIMKDRYQIMFVFPGDRGGFMSAEFRMNMESRPKVYRAVQDDEKERAKKEIEKELPKDSGVKVDTEKRGLVLRLGEVLFDFDSHKLKDDSKKVLSSVVDVIKKRYPDREIIVEGHTDSVGETGYNMKLSLDRSRTVAEYLKPGIGGDKLSYRGMGPASPIGDNATAEGRKKNRRVEIIIKLN